jgi:signal transduction histidine kinase
MLSKELNPPIGRESLYDALEWLTLQMGNDYGLSVEMKAKGPAGDIDKPVRTFLFHTVRELLFNVVKHADVDEASLFLVQGEERIRVVVEDEGAGFDPSEIEEWTDGTGLAGLRERIEVVGGQVEIETTPGGGTRVALEVPRQTGGGSMRWRCRACPWRGPTAPVPDAHGGRTGARHAPVVV